MMERISSEIIIHSFIGIMQKKDYKKYNQIKE